MSELVFIEADPDNPIRCCGRCGHTPAEIAKYKRWGEDGACRDMYQTRHDHHVWIWWPELVGTQQQEKTPHNEYV